jgi:hypothetical protein
LRVFHSYSDAVESKGMARLWDGDHVEAVHAKQHGSFSSIVVSRQKNHVAPLQCRHGRATMRLDDTGNGREKFARYRE